MGHYDDDGFSSFMANVQNQHSLDCNLVEFYQDIQGWEGIGQAAAYMADSESLIFVDASIRLYKDREAFDND